MSDNRIREGDHFDEIPSSWSQVVEDRSAGPIYYDAETGRHVVVEPVDSSAYQIREVGDLIVEAEPDQDAIQEGCDELGLDGEAVAGIKHWYAEQASGTIELELERVRDSSDVVTARDRMVSFTEYHEPEQYEEIVRALGLDVDSKELGQTLPLEDITGGTDSGGDWVATVDVRS